MPSNASQPDYFIGLMSGTSLDGVDGVLVDFSGSKPAVVLHQWSSFATNLRAELLTLNTPGDNELHRAALAGSALARLYAEVALALLAASGLERHAIAAIGAHGQTVRHRPGEFDADPANALPALGYTVQLNNPALLAELTGIDVVADFRTRDVAAGGQGAPLAPAFHRGVFAQPGQTVGVLNLGGISNLTVLPADPADGVLGFDCGPANGLMDHWCQQHRSQPFDAAGAWAASGRTIEPLLARLLAEPYLALPPPKSTGRDLFNPAWLATQLQGFGQAAPADVQATLAAFTVHSCVADVRRHAPDCTRLVVCGGGALNGHLMHSLQAALPGVAVESSAEQGLPPLQVEATAFAWLARTCVRREKLDLKSITGARGARVLGAVYPA